MGQDASALLDLAGGSLRARYGILPPQREAIRLFCGVCEDDWQGFPVEVGPYACISPVYGRTGATKRSNEAQLSPRTTAVIQDSGAFCDQPGSRLTFDQALRRQIDHADRRGYAERVTHRASYDLLVDEKWSLTTGRRSKSRWSEEEAWDACVTTIQAAKFLSAHREGLRCLLSAQGVTPAQYLKCAQGVFDSEKKVQLLSRFSARGGSQPRQTVTHQRGFANDWLALLGARKGGSFSLLLRN